ncbi:MAG: hypothetical protein JO271_12980 [Verrucomicrobia bacterium]|nr:hypothetical protein [Verrucomicrobiota bacterium]
MIQLDELYNVIGRRLTRSLLGAGWLTPAHPGGHRGTVFERREVHLALRRLQREGALLGARYHLATPPKAAKRMVPSFEDALDEHRDAIRDALTRL